MHNLPKQWKFSGEVHHLVAVNTCEGVTVVTYKVWRARVWQYCADTIGNVRYRIHLGKDQEKKS